MKEAINAPQHGDAPCKSAPHPTLTWLLFLSALVTVHAAADPAPAFLRVFAADRARQPIPTQITGKFAEHLNPGRGWHPDALGNNINKGDNIYNGMDAQVLRNPTFAAYQFPGGTDPDGTLAFHYEREIIGKDIRRCAPFQGWPQQELDRLVESYQDGLACWWTRVGPREAVTISPDTGSCGGRAQRIELTAAGQGIAQWTYLPLHRTRKFEFELYARAIGVRSLTVSFAAAADSPPESRAAVGGLKPDWRKFTGTLEMPATLPANAAYRFAIVADGPGQLVLGRALLRPADHVNGADPDVVRLLKESRLPLLRWPGGNFVSGYHWEDGVGPLERRPARPNYAWGGVEPNLFGTDEFIAFCRAVGCEPIVCINGGNGTPEEAARWVQYCNGSAKTPMGRLRAANGHPKPYNVTRWEVGNELWGRRGQIYWTTPGGYLDRYERFAKALLAADPNIKLYACGAQGLRGSRWNDTLLAGAAPMLHALTDHALIGGTVPLSADPLDVYRDFMAVPGMFERKWAGQRDDMARAGINNPRLAVTELQMFAFLGAPGTNGPARLTLSNLVDPGTVAEALYDVLFYHAAVRLDPFVELITHSATVNHGGGLRKEHERVYANPCYYAQAAFADLGGATPVRLELEAATERAPLVLPSLRNLGREETFKTVDALAALAPKGDLLLSIVHCASSGSTRLAVELRDFAAAGQAEVRTLSAPVPWAANSLNNPDAIKPLEAAVAVHNGRFTLELAPYSVLRVRVPASPSASAASTSIPSS
jgi:alpha-N-arabinofuranosidase